MANWTRNRKLRILAKDYDLHFEHDFTDGDGVKLDGQHRFHEETITIEKSLPPKGQWSTVWHEAVHSITSQIGQSDLYLNEAYIETMATAIIQILKDNPHMRLWK